MGDLHDSKTEHACQGDALAKRDLYIKEIFCRPKEDDEVAESVLPRVEIVDGFDIEAFRGANVFKDLPVCASRSLIIVSSCGCR